MKKRIMNKLRGCSGESIGETLVALLISSLALVMLAGAISSASRVVTRGKAKLTEYYAEEIKLVEQTTPTSSIVVTLKDADAASDDALTTRDYNAETFENAGFGNRIVTSYRLTGLDGDGTGLDIGTGG